MTEDERYAMETLSAEAARLKNDPSFAAAVIELHKAAEAKLTELNQQLVDAVLDNQDTGEARAAIVQQRATLQAITGLTTEIGNQILRGKSRSIKPVA